MSSFSIVLLSRFAGVDQRSGERGRAYANSGCGFPAQAGFVLCGFFARFGAFDFAHGFVVGWGIVWCVSHKG